jgi:hypothetical protein
MPYDTGLPGVARCSRPSRASPRPRPHARDSNLARTAPDAPAGGTLTQEAFAAEDNLDIVEATQTIWLRFDRVTPKTVTDIPSSNVVTAPVISLVASDSDSGVAPCWFSLDGGLPTEVSSPAGIAPGSYGLHTLT